MQVCAKDTCMGYAKNIRNDPNSFVGGKEDAVLINYMQKNGVYSTPGAETMFPKNIDLYNGNPFTCFIRKQRPFRGGFMLLSSERFSTTYDDCYC